MAAKRELGGGGQQCDSTHAEGVDRDERATEQRAERTSADPTLPLEWLRSYSFRTLAALVKSGVKATAEDIAKSLEGNWREELLFVLRERGTVSHLSREDLRLRSATVPASGVVGVQRGHPSAAHRAEAERQERQSERSSIRFTHGVISHYGHRLGTNQRH